MTILTKIPELGLIGTGSSSAMHEIQGMDWIIHFLRTQAAMRDEGNDEGGILSGAAEYIRHAMIDLEGPSEAYKFNDTTW